MELMSTLGVYLISLEENDRTKSQIHVRKISIIGYSYKSNASVMCFNIQWESIGNDQKANVSVSRLSVELSNMLIKETDCQLNL